MKKRDVKMTTFGLLKTDHITITFSDTISDRVPFLIRVGMTLITEFVLSYKIRITKGHFPLSKLVPAMSHERTTLPSKKEKKRNALLQSSSQLPLFTNCPGGLPARQGRRDNCGWVEYPFFGSAIMCRVLLVWVCGVLPYS